MGSLEITFRQPTMLPKNLFVVLLTLTASLKTSFGNTCQPYYSDCSTKSFQCKIKCTDIDDPTTCIGEIGDGGTCPEDTAVQEEQMTADVCKNLCTTANSCFYYKFEESGGPEPHRYCYLMGEQECNEWGEGCDNPAICVSGKGDENNCDDGIGYTCVGGTQHTHGIMPDFKLHWSCISIEGGSVDIKDTSIPGDTTCTAHPECGGELITYECKSNGDQIAPKGVWAYIGSGTDPNFQEDVDGTQNKLTDPSCNAENLQLTDYKQQVQKGMQILCVIENSIDENAGTISAQNSCLLICDNYPILNFWTDAKQWKYQLMDSSTEEDLPAEADDVIFCHKGTMM